MIAAVKLYICVQFRCPQPQSNNAASPALPNASYKLPHKHTLNTLPQQPSAVSQPFVWQAVEAAAGGTWSLFSGSTNV